MGTTLKTHCTLQHPLYTWGWLCSSDPFLQSGFTILSTYHTAGSVLRHQGSLVSKTGQVLLLVIPAVGVGAPPQRHSVWGKLLQQQQETSAVTMPRSVQKGNTVHAFPHLLPYNAFLSWCVSANAPGDLKEAFSEATKVPYKFCIKVSSCVVDQGLARCRRI